MREKEEEGEFWKDLERECENIGKGMGWRRGVEWKSMIMETVYDNLNMDNAQVLAMQTHTHNRKDKYS